MTRILFLGDVHGNEHWLRMSMSKARDLECDLLVQLGDFGYWEHTRKGKYYLQMCEIMVTKFGLPIIFIDGNHENHSMLVEYLDKPFTYGVQDCDLEEVRQIREGLGWIPRGALLSMGGVNFMGLGGSYSIDKHLRKLGVSWWDTETVSIADVQVAIANFDNSSRDVDVMLAHDTVYGAPMDLIVPGSSPGDFPESLAVRLKLRDVADHIKPKFWLHGHYHTRIRYEVQLSDDVIMTCLGLAEDGPRHAFETRFSDTAFLMDTAQYAEETLRP